MDQLAPTGHEKPLDDAQRRLEAVLNNASVSIFLMDDRQQCIYMNRAAEELTGFTFEEVLALDKPLHDIIHHTHPDGRPFPLSECVIDRAFPEYNQQQGEEVFVHKNGGFYPVAFTASPVLDEASRTVGTIVEVRNTAAEKIAAERQKLLMNELNHRVKNTLATVQAVAWQTFKNGDSAAVDSFMGRLSILSRAHNILTGTAWHKAALAEVVNTAVEPFGASRFKIEGPDCEVHPKVAISLSMVLHELGTNAAKYGALSEHEGRVSVRWRCEGKDQATILDLVWEENGGPPVEKPARRGFGTRLIERQLRLEFGGSAKLEFRKDGFVCRMHLEMPANPEPLDVQLLPAAR
jgi:PAS domain S-box-containing protein